MCCQCFGKGEVRRGVVRRCIMKILEDNHLDDNMSKWIKETILLSNNVDVEITQETVDEALKLCEKNKCINPDYSECAKLLNDI